ncbi:MAG: MaoC family dehydratase N-terminal domain-containing protein [Acetobacteraceae bacterium]
MDAAAWIGRARSVSDTLAAPLVRRLAATLDAEMPAGVVPSHWLPALLFDDAQPTRALGPDGHPAKGEFLPPVPLPRRMLAGRRVTFHAPARIGQDFTRTSTIEKIEEKQGRSGRLVFVTVRHATVGPDGPAMTEVQDIVYREAAGGSAASRAPEPMPPPAWREARTPDTVLLFRYSAICFNGHRIHYDADYARDAEGYPALVVNGGLSTLLLLDAAVRSTGRAIAGFAARTVSPLFCGRALALCGTAPDEAGRALLWAEDDAGAVALRVEVEFAR